MIDSTAIAARFDALCAATIKMDGSVNQDV